jgi:Holliday junction DNA helicase RuvA
MIGYIRGKITGIYKDFCFIETGGIGYRVFISDKTIENLHIDEEVKLLTYMAVREDAILLYGFLTSAEYELFKVLISISKIGPKVAIGILSTMSPERFVQLVQTQDVKALTKLPGVGKKTAERLLVEIKDKVGTLGTEGEASPLPTDQEASPVQAQAAEYLAVLGYAKNEIDPVLSRLGPDWKSASALVAAALREFGKDR